MNISMIYLALAIIAEVAGTVSMKLSAGFTKLVPSTLIFIFYGTSLIFLTYALKKIDVSIVYTIWAGVGTALIAIIGMTFFRESVDWIKIGSISLIVIGVIGLNLSGIR